MIELTWAQIRDHAFQGALEKLSQTPFDFKISYHIGRIKAKVVSEANLSQEWFMKLVKQYADIDEKTQQFTVKPEHIEKWQAEIKSFGETKFTVEKHKLNVADLTGAKLTPNDILALEPLLFGLEALEGGSNG